MINPVLRAMLVCPVEHAPLRDVPDALECTVCGRRYPIEDDIPNMIPQQMPDAESTMTPES
ncbi:MAG TPA: Trm112 family protein [Armatimonadota bacterium]